MSIKLGSTAINAIYLGSTAISAAYLGATQVYSADSAPVLPTLSSGDYSFAWLAGTETYSNAGGTIPAADGGGMRVVDDQRGPTFGTTLSNFAPSQRPTLRASGAGFYGEWDATDDFLQSDSVASAATSSSVIVMAVRATVTPASLVWDNTTSSYLGFWADGSTSTAITNGAGSPTVRVNGATVSTRAELFAGAANGNWNVVSFDGADISGWGNFRIGRQGGAIFSGDLLLPTIYPKTTTADREAVEAYYAALIERLA